MAVRPRRGKWGTRKSRVPLFVEVAPEAKETLEAIVAATGEPKWAIVEALLERVEFDAHGRPLGWPAAGQQEELPLKTA